MSFIPSLYTPSGDIVSYAPADGLFADSDGDRIPDVAIGRLPGAHHRRCRRAGRKDLQYETLTGRKSLLLAADGYDTPSHFSFSQSSEELAGSVPPAWQIDRVYLDAMSVADARTELIGKLNGGVAVTSYMGHSGPIAWTFDGLFNNSDAAGLTNDRSCRPWCCSGAAGPPTSSSRPTTPWRTSCSLSGSRARRRCSARRRSPRRAPSARISLEIFSRIFEPGATLGQGRPRRQAHSRGRRRPRLLDVLVGWNLLGDPTLGIGGEGSVVTNDMPFENGFEIGDRPWSTIQQ